VKFDDLASKVVFVTGGARGIGFTIAKAMARQGCSVGLLDLLPTVIDAAELIHSEVGVKAAGCIVDVTDDVAVQAAFDELSERIGVPQLLITAAGITVWNDSVNVPAAEWRRVLDVNLNGTFFAAQCFCRLLQRAGVPGTAVFVASMSGSIVNVPQNQASYNASKAAVSHLGKSLAVEWAPNGIRVNSISPGYILSDMTRQFTDNNVELAAAWTARIPLGRMGTPDDLCGLVLFLSSDASSYITGQDIVIDGGYTVV